MNNIRIKSVETVQTELIELEGKHWKDYRRLSPGNWEVRMGESWEPAYCDEDELEALYLAWKRENDGKTS